MPRQATAIIRRPVLDSDGPTPSVCFSATSHGRKRGRVRRIAAVLLAAAVGLSANPGQVMAADEMPEQFPDVAHRDQTFYACTSCHGFKLVAAQGMTRDKWAETLVWMTAKHNLPQLEAQELNNVLDYLSVAFPPKAPTQRGWKNPFGD